MHYSKSGQRKWLLARREDLLAQLEAAHTALADAPDQDGAEAADFKDVTDRRQRAELHDTEMRRDLDELTAVDDALRRLDEGRYGTCVVCGESIDARRLVAHPAAARCMKCQMAFEASGIARR